MSIATVYRTLTLIFAGYALQAQNFTKPFEDKEPKPDSYVRGTAYEPGFVYMAGSTTNTCGVVPFIQKVSMDDGSVLWSTNDNASITFQFARTVSAITIVGEFIYGFVPSAFSDPGEVWKINKTTGAILWRSKVPQGTSSSRTGIYGILDTHVVVYSYYDAHLFNAQTGVLEKTYDDDWGTVIGATANGAVVIRDRNDGAIKLVRNFDFANPETVVAFPYDTYYCNRDVLIRAYAVDSDRLLIFASQGCSRGVTLIDLNQKKVLWQTDALPGTGSDLSDYTIQDGYLYACFRALYGGGTTNSFSAAKINMSTGAFVWNSYQGFKPNYQGSEGLYTYMNQGRAASVCVDGTGDVYVTGNANTQEGTGDFGIIKLAGATGQKVYDRIITESDRDFDYYSNGVRAVNYKGVPYFIGNVSAGSNYVFNSSTTPVSPGNNIVMVQLQPSDGATLKRYNYTGRKVEGSRVKKMVAYKDGHTLMLQTKGRKTFLSRYARNLDLVWETELKATKVQYYGQEPIDLAVDAAGNIGVLTMALGLTTSSEMVNSDPMAFVISENGAVTQEFTKLGGYNVFNAYADGDQFFFCTGDGFYTIITRVDATGARKSATYSRTQVEGKAAGRRMASASNNKLVLLGEYFYGALVDKTTLQVTELGKLLPSGDWSDPEDMLVANDTLYAVAYDATGSNGSYTSVLCYSLIDKKMIWRNTASTGNYYRLERDAKGDIYALGTGQYSGMLIRKIKGSTGVSLWSDLRTYSNDIEANDLFIDKRRNQVAVTGYQNVSQKPYYATVIYDANYGSVRLLSISSSMGRGLTIGQAGNGDVISGGELLNTNSCGAYSVGVSASYATTAMKPVAINASQNLEDRVTINWESGGSGAYYRVFRYTEDKFSLAEPVSGFITATSFDDVKAAVATQYYYYVSASLDQYGKGATGLDASGIGFRIISPPVVDSVMASEGKVLQVAWGTSDKATYYRVHRAAHPAAAEAEPITGWIRETTHADTGREPGVSYYYFVQAAQNDQGGFASNLSTPREGKIAVITGNEQGQHETLAVYPNPVSDQLAIRYSSTYRGDVTISLSTTQGRETLVIDAVKQDFEFDAVYSLDSLRSGIYILTIRERTQGVIQRKVVKQ